PHSIPQLDAHFTTARMTAFSPGASPPPVSTPMRSIESMPVECSSKKSRVVESGFCPRGRLAQMGERGVRNAEVGSSILLPSTNLRSDVDPRASVGKPIFGVVLIRELPFASQRRSHLEHQDERMAR